jgi:L-threonylcarbamoyladenylate synthase
MLMKTELIKVKSKNKNNVLSKAADLIKKGEIVAFPTETVYGLGANAFNDSAIQKIFIAKGRPSDNPLIVHISDLDQLKDLVEFVPQKAKLLMKKYWPGPLTIVMKKSSLVPLSVTAGLDTVAVRMPSNKIALELIKKANVPIAAPSANSSTKPSPTMAKHVLEDLNGKVPLILDGGNCDIGVESTVIGLVGEKPILFRPGKVTLEELKKILGEIDAPKSVSKNSPPQSPGMKYKHYAPKARVFLFSTKNELLNLIKNESFVLTKKKCLVLGIKSFGLKFCREITFKSVKEYTKNLFLQFRWADEQNYEIIFVQKVKEEKLGLALMNRLKKASFNSEN